MKTDNENGSKKGASKGENKFVFVVIIIIGAVFFGWDFYSKKKRNEAFLAVVGDISGLKNACIEKGDQHFTIRGTCLVWDTVENEIGKAYYSLPSTLAAEDADGQLTVFLVAPGDKELVGDYSNTKAKAYRQNMDIYVVYWPQKEAVAAHRVPGESPPEETTFMKGTQGGGVIGDTAKPIAEWIESLPRE